MLPSDSNAAAPALSRNQQQKRARRDKIKQEKEQATNQQNQSDPLCVQLMEALANAQDKLAGRFRAALISSSSTAAASSSSLSKKRRTDAGSTSDSAAAASSSASSPSPCVSTIAFGASGIIARIPSESQEPLTAVVIDQARQMQASYQSHRLTAEGVFTAGFVRHASAAQGEDGPACACDLFRLDAPYQLTPSVAAAATSATAAIPATGAKQEVPTPAGTSLYRNDSASDLVITHAGALHVMPPHSAALISDISLASEIVDKLRPASGFELVVMDPPWESKSVRRSARYESMDHRLLASHLPVVSLLSPSLPCFVAIWVTNNPVFHSYVQDTLFPLWGVRHEATWTWLKLSDDGRMVLPLHPVSDTAHRKPYEQLLIGWRGPLAGAAAASSMEAAAAPAATLPPSFPRSLTLLSVPGSKHHSRKPQLGELFAPYLSPDPSCVELFARNFSAGWSCWGNEAIKFQQFA